jgi:hypothetical protein
MTSGVFKKTAATDRPKHDRATSLADKTDVRLVRTYRGFSPAVVFFVPTIILDQAMAIIERVRNLFAGNKAVPAPIVPFEIVEGVESTWSYHLAVPSAYKSHGRVALCGRGNLMPTAQTLDGWNARAAHIPEHYCAKCDAAARAQGVDLPPPRIC